MRLGQSIFVDLGSIAPDGSWDFDLRLTLRVRGCRTALRLCVVFKMQIPPEHSAISHPPRYGATCGNGILAYRACGKVVARPTCCVLVSYIPALLTLRADRERIIRLRRLVLASLQHNANVDERCPCVDTVARITLSSISLVTRRVSLRELLVGQMVKDTKTVCHPA